MEIKVRTILNFAKYLGSREVTLQVGEGSTVRSALGELASFAGGRMREEIFDPATGEPYAYLLILVNGRDVRFLQGLETVLKESDILLVFPPAAGG
ncbi:MAG: MoaD/ThiS family protein [Peptococcaceae bacterium]|nr:MoaD/ThiS family protein [Peptococcaceae bacterium]